MRKISILVPCFNEEESLPLLVPELDSVADSMPQYEWEYLFVNDGSRDNTLDVIAELQKSNTRINYIDLSRNYGKEVAMLAGFDYVTGDCMVIMDADLQHPPFVIPQMIEKWEQGYDDIYARRLSRGSESWLRKRLSALYYKILSNLSTTDVLPNVGDFRLLDRQCIEALRTLRESNRYTKGMYNYIGFRKTYVEFNTRDRQAGESSMSYRSLVRLAMEGILSYTIAPLRIATFIGSLTSLGAFIYMLFVFIKAMLYGDPVQGYPTLMVVILFLGGMQLLSLGIIGEYLGRVFIESKKRPAYFVRLHNGKKI